MQRRPTVGPGSQKAPFRERLPGAIYKLGKGTALQRRPNGGWRGGWSGAGDWDRVVVVVVVAMTELGVGRVVVQWVVRVVVG